MTFVPATAASASRSSGQIKLHGPEGFAGMRKAGRVAAACLDMVAAQCRCPASRQPSSTR